MLLDELLELELLDELLELEELELELAELAELTELEDWLETLDQLDGLEELDEECELLLDELDELVELELRLLAEDPLDALELETLDELELELVDWLDLLELDVELCELRLEDEELEDELLEELDDRELLDTLLELLLELELDTLLPLVLIELLDLLLLDVLIELDELELLDEVETSSIDKIQSRSPLLGPGNCMAPVWKLITSATETSPVVRVSTKVACHMILSGSVSEAVTALPANVSEIVGEGMTSSPAPGQRQIVSRRLVKPTAGPRPKATFLGIARIRYAVWRERSRPRCPQPLRDA